MKFYLTTSERETFLIGKALGEKLRGGEIILLEGELGAGKTVFTKGLATALSISDEIKSPTFTYMIEYEGKDLKLYHFDAYRLSDGVEAEERGLTEYFGQKDGVCVVEWPQNIKSCFEWLNVIRVKINYTDENSREIIVYDE